MDSDEYKKIKAKSNVISLPWSNKNELKNHQNPDTNSMAKFNGEEDDLEFDLLPIRFIDEDEAYGFLQVLTQLRKASNYSNFSISVRGDDLIISIDSSIANTLHEDGFIEVHKLNVHELKTILVFSDDEDSVDLNTSTIEESINLLIDAYTPIDD